MIDFYKEVGQKINALRKKKKMSQKELAEKLGKGSATYVNLVESGKRKVSVRSLVKIAKALDVTLNAFLDEHYTALDTDQLLRLALVSDEKITSAQREIIIDFINFLRTKND